MAAPNLFLAQGGI